MAEDFVVNYIINNDQAVTPLGEVDRALNRNQVALSATDQKAKILSSTYANMKTTAIEGGLSPALVTPKGADKGLIAAQNDALAQGEMWLGRSAVAASAYGDRIKRLVVDTQALGRAQADVSTKSPRLFDRMEDALVAQDQALARADKQKPLIYDKTELTRQFSTWEAQARAQQRSIVRLAAERKAALAAMSDQRWTNLSGLQRIGATLAGGMQGEDLKRLKADFKGFIDTIRQTGNLQSGLDVFWRGIGNFFGTPLRSKIGNTVDAVGNFEKAIGKLSGANLNLNPLQTILARVTSHFGGVSKAATSAKAPAYQAAIALRAVGSAFTAQNWQSGIYYLSLVGRGMQGVAMSAALAATGVVLAGVAFAKLVTIGARVEGITTAFRNMTHAAGLAGPALRDSLQETSNYALASVDAMRIANRAMMAGGAEMAMELPRVLEAARLASLATGQDMTKIFDDLFKGIVRGSPKLIDNADIYLKIGDAVGAYAKEQGKAVSEVTASEKQFAVLNAVLAKTPELIAQIGMESATSSEKLQSLGAATKDLGAALGEVAVYSGVADIIANIATAIRGFGRGVETEQAIRKLRDDLEGIDTTDAKGALSGMNSEIAKASALYMDGSLTAAQFYAVLGQLADQYQVLIDSGFKVTRSLTQMPDALENGKARVQEWKAAAESAAASQAAFTEALMETIDTAKSFESWGKLAGQMELLAQTPLPQPELGSAPLATDVAAWQNYLTVLRAARPDLESVIDRTRESVDMLGRQEQAIIASASAMGPGAAALNYLAQAAFGVGAGVLDLVNNFDKLSPAAQRAITQLGLLGSALDALQAKAAKGVSLDMQIKGVEQAQADIRSAAMSLVGIMPEKDIRAFEQRANADLTSDIAQHLRTRGDITQFELDLMLRDHVSYYQNLTEEERNYYNQSAQRAKEAAKITKKSADEVRSAIENALSKGLEVTQGDMLATKAGTYRDKALESARRLNAIAERGFEELKVHPDWAGALNIPPEVIAQGEDALKAWAAKTSEDVQNLTRPDLINWDAFIANYKQSLQDESAKEITLDIALGKLKAAGLLEGKSEDAARKEVLKMLGLDEPEVKFATYFPEATTDDPAVRAVQNYLRNGQPVQVQYQWVASGQQFGLIPGGMPITPDQTAQLEWANQMAKAQGAWPKSPATMTPKLGPPTPGEYIALQNQVNTGLAAAPVNVVAGLGFNAANLEAYRNSVVAYFTDNPVSVDTDLYDPEEMVNLYRGRVEAWFTDNPLVLDTALGGTTNAELYRRSIEGFFIERPLIIDTVLGGSQESVDLYRDGVEGLFLLDPLKIMTQLVLPESNAPFGAPPPGQTEPPLGQQANYYGGKVAGLASMNPYASMGTGADMTKPGQDIAGALYSSFDLAVKAQTPGAAVASAWAANFATAEPMFKAIGTSAGDQVGQATVDAIVGKVGGVVKKMAEVIAPEVALILGKQKAGGALP